MPIVNRIGLELADDHTGYALRIEIDSEVLTRTILNGSTQGDLLPALEAAQGALNDHIMRLRKSVGASPLTTHSSPPGALDSNIITLRSKPRRKRPEGDPQ